MIEVINVLAELERAGVKFDWAGDEEVKCKCPFHEDDSPSCHINVEKRLFKCHASGCAQSGDILTFMAGLLKTSRAIVWAEMAPRYDVSHEKLIDPAVIERWHGQIWSAYPLLKELYARGVNDGMIRRWRLGVEDGRITIPIKNEQGLYVNVRRYLPGAPGKDKMKNMRGHSKIRLCPVEQLKFDTIVICGGEVKAFVAIEQLNPHGIGALCATAGEGNWDPSFSNKLMGKKVYSCMDVDEGGRTASISICLQVYRVASWVGDVLLPLDIDKYPHGDINDFVACEQGQLLPLLEATPQFVPASKIVLNENEPIELSLAEAVNARHTGERVKVRVVVPVVVEPPFPIPKTVEYTCDRAQPECSACDLFQKQEQVVALHPESPAILEMISATKRAQREALMHGVGVPPTCSSVQFEAKTYFNVEECRISPRLEITNRSADRMMQPAYIIGDRVEMNESYEMVGRMYPHPLNQHATMLMSSYVATSDALSSYRLEDPDPLKIFQPSEWTLESLEAKLDDVYSDLETNVTRIFQRRRLHVFVDFAYHSPLFVTFDGRVVKGWVEVLIMGDSSQGKSEVGCGFDGNGGLMKHYDLGTMVECKNASVAGLLGGCLQSGSRWIISWGIIPTHDKRLVFLEELKGASVEVISKCTQMRSSGIAEIPKIEKRRTYARTRLVAFSNARSERDISTYSYGIEAVKELIGGLEDVRRFDAVAIVSRQEVDSVEINKLQTNRPHHEHTFTSELCKELVLWSWTRSPEQVVVSQDVVQVILDHATKMCDDYDESIPIVDKGSMRYKLARLSAAVACRTFSCSDDYESVIVRPCHVEFVAKTLREAYDTQAFGYKDYTKSKRISEDMGAPEDITKRIHELPFPGDFCKHILAANAIDPQDIQDWSGWGRQESGAMMSFLVRKHALRRSGRMYYKSPPFIEMLKGLLSNGALKDRPDFIPESSEF